MSRKSRLMLTLVSAAAMLSATLIASTHSHFTVRGSDEISVESFCPCTFHDSDSGPDGKDGESKCLICKLLAELNSEAPLHFEFALTESVSSFADLEPVEISIEPIRRFRGRAPPAV